MWKRALGVLLVLSAVAGCTPVAPSGSSGSVSSPVTNLPRSGTILSLRPVAAASQQIASIGNAIGASLGTARAGSGTTEFIVRTSDGNMISVVQTNTAELRPGDHVSILPDGGLHLVRIGS